MIELTDREKKLLDIAKLFLAINPKMSITGSLMLKLRGIDLGRETHDLDLLIPDWSTAVEVPNELNLVESKRSSLELSLCYKLVDNDDIIIDILSSNDETEIINGINLVKTECLITAKYNFYIQNGKSREKHYNDLIKLGYNFNNENCDSDDLPF